MKKSRFKPNFKKIIKLRENVQNKKKIFNFKKNKWIQFLSFYKRKLQKYRRMIPCDQTLYTVSIRPDRWSSYKKKYANSLYTRKRFGLFYGGLSFKEFKKRIKQSSKNKKTTLLRYFESRLDTVLYRAKFCRSIREARQLITHGKILVNHKIVKSKSYVLSTGDLISVQFKDIHLIKENLSDFKQKQRLLPIPQKHLFINYRTMQILFGETDNTNFLDSTLLNLNLETLFENSIY